MDGYAGNKEDPEFFRSVETRGKLPKEQILTGEL